MGATDEREYFALREEQLSRRLEHEHGITRRDVLRRGAAAGVPLVLGTGLLGRVRPARAATGSPVPGIVKPLPPEWFIPLGTNAEMRWEAMRDEGYTTPWPKFYVRNHTSTPLVDARTWRLRVFGSGLRRGEASFSLRDLRRLPRRSVTKFIECAGNGRSFFDTQQHTPATGSQWKLGGIGVARWTGVPLAEVLERAGISRRAVDVMPAGLDPTVVSNGVDQGHVRRPLPVEKALDDALLAYEMNGDPLPPDHGAPVRLVVPGWVGIASIKWVGSLEVADEPLFSPWNTTMYTLTGPSYPEPVPVTRQVVKSAFELPFPATVRPGRRLRLHGRSWSGSGAVGEVEVRIDGPSGPGRWQPVHLRRPDRPEAWVRWELPWTPREVGAHELLARAVDTRGHGQPDTVPFNTGGYLFGAVVRHPVTVAA